MNKLISLGIGFGIGALLGAAVVLLFAPTSGETLVRQLKAGYSETMEEARGAAAARRETLEAELKQRRALVAKTKA